MKAFSTMWELSSVLCCGPCSCGAGGIAIAWSVFIAVVVVGARSAAYRSLPCWWQAVMAIAARATKWPRR